MQYRLALERLLEPIRAKARGLSLRRPETTSETRRSACRSVSAPKACSTSPTPDHAAAGYPLQTSAPAKLFKTVGSCRKFQAARNESSCSHLATRCTQWYAVQPHILHSHMGLGDDVFFDQVRSAESPSAADSCRPGSGPQSFHAERLQINDWRTAGWRPPPLWCCGTRLAARCRRMRHRPAGVAIDRGRRQGVEGHWREWAAWRAPSSSRY